MILEKYANMKSKYGNQEFWCREYYVVDTVGKDTKSKYRTISDTSYKKMWSVSR